MADDIIVWPSTLCNDGWQSSSIGPGTCSSHGGVNYNADQSNNTIGWEWVAVSIALWIAVIAWWKS